MGATSVHYAIESFENDAWGEWYATDNRRDVERMWKRLQLVKPQVPVRLMEVEVLPVDEDAGGTRGSPHRPQRGTLD